jgi:hypothetical protein
MIIRIYCPFYLSYIYYDLYTASKFLFLDVKEHNFYLWRGSDISPTRTCFGLAENGKRPSILSPPEHSMEIEGSTHDIFLESSLLQVSNDIGVCGILQSFEVSK